MNKQKQAFLIGLEKLTRETGVIITGHDYQLYPDEPCLRMATKEELDPRAGYASEWTTQWIYPDGSYPYPADKFSWERAANGIVKEITDTEEDTQS
jgi:hypothetical protein